MSTTDVYKIVGGPMSGEKRVPSALDMQRHPDARPIRASDPSPIASAARAEASQSQNEDLTKRTFKYPEGNVSFYSPESITNIQALKLLGLTASQYLDPDRDTLLWHLENFEG